MVHFRGNPDNLACAQETTLPPVTLHDQIVVLSIAMKSTLFNLSFQNRGVPSHSVETTHSQKRFPVQMASAKKESPPSPETFSAEETILTQDSVPVAEREDGLGAWRFDLL
jgi:hypothetical protein